MGVRTPPLAPDLPASDRARARPSFDRTRRSPPPSQNPRILPPMTHTVRETGQWQHTLTIEVPSDEVERRLGDVSRRFQQVVSLPGFRKGKVPLERVRQDYAAEIEREFLERFIPEVTQRAIEESALKAVVPPSV